MIEPKKSRDTAIGRKGPAYGHDILLRRRLAQSDARARSWVYFVIAGNLIVVMGGVITLLVAPVGIFFIPIGLSVSLWGLATKPQQPPPPRA
jgi:hypothetical protein